MAQGYSLSLYLNHKDGFYVYAESKDCKRDTVRKYIGRYFGRPVIAASRIDSYDGDSVTFHYNRQDLLDMDYFLHESVFGEDDGNDGFFYILVQSIVCF
nr:transposase [Hungatella effluvii]